MSASLQVPLSSTTSSSDKKASVISNNKPNCNTPKGLSKAPHTHAKGEDNQTAKPSSDAKLELTDNKGESEDKTPNSDVTLNTMSGSNKDFPESQTKYVIYKSQFDQANEATNIDKGVVLQNVEANASNNVEADGKAVNDPEKKEDEPSSHPGTTAKKIITSEDEAKAKLAEKRREAKEKKEREAELERQRQVC